MSLLSFQLYKSFFKICGGTAASAVNHHHRENTRREESKYLECENRQLGLSAIATYIFKPPKEKFKIGR